MNIYLELHTHGKDYSQEVRSCCGGALWEIQSHNGGSAKIFFNSYRELRDFLEEALALLPSEPTADALAAEVFELGATNEAQA